MKGSPSTQKRTIKSWKVRSYQEEKKWGSTHSLGVNSKTAKKPKEHHVGPRIRGSSITTDPLSQKCMNLVTDGHNAKTSLKSRMVNSSNQVKFAAPEKKKGQEYTVPCSKRHKTADVSSAYKDSTGRGEERPGRRIPVISG